MARETSKDVICRYLQDAIAAERNFESQLKSMAGEGNQPEVQQLFSRHAEETRVQHQRLTRRLEELGETPSMAKSFMAHIFSFTPKVAQFGHEEEEKAVQDLMMAYAVENSEVAMYEALATVAAAAGDTATEQLARDIQEEERAAARKIWDLLVPTTKRSYQVLLAGPAR
jgi:ferritin-like metal-binding protein YciE